MQPLIIIGAGLAGYTVAREFRKLDKTAAMVIITADDGDFYSKPMLSNAFAQSKSAQQLVTQSAAKMAEQLGASIVTGTRVTRIDTAENTVVTTTGTYHYGRLVLAMGAQPIRLAFDGDAADAVLAVNHVSDYAAFRARIAQVEPRGPARVAILGAGLIGCEFADDLAGAGHAVTLIDPNAAPLSALAAPTLSRGLEAALKARGVSMRFGTTAARIDRRDDALQVTLASGASFDTDVVLSAVGLRPDLDVANGSGLTTRRGIVVDATGQTSAPGVYALGDCAEYTFDADGTTRTLPYIAPLMTAARAIARTLAGQPTAIDLKAAPVIVKTPSYPLALLPPPPHAAANGNWHAADDGARTVCRFYDEQDVLVGFGVAPHEANVRTELLSALGTKRGIDIAA
ncbi:FAD-dependent oxidoreductase [Noviherbaspirillum cavernae]|uniref:FAD-dependent oxidoreductase n=1 Tax=Noviherbaspirillum cavernae TaxID=2320862 RepID=A0A418WYR9_9BURK|nr:FAD-dependent oxidoreductase [Noviherbaspirillum cavernae]RJG05311.1 FAD-dependent oxidoreductase [Noviherbaspirillum cavernae]